MNRKARNFIGFSPKQAAKEINSARRLPDWRCKRCRFGSLMEKRSLS
jgi:hypothetical protein